MTHIPKKIRIVLAGGGTAGHIYPLVVVARELGKGIIDIGSEPDIRFFGDPQEHVGAFETVGVRTVHIPASKLRRYLDFANFLDSFRFIGGLIISLWKLYWFMPHACFSKGGPGALAVVSAARFYGIPIIVHESDAIPGITNRITGGHARLVELAFASAAAYFDGRNTHVVGNPVREEIFRSEDPRAAKLEFSFNPDKPVILFIGGSQGAELFNDFILKNITDLVGSFQILHQTGSKNFENHQNQVVFLKKEGVGSAYRFVPYFEQNIVRAYAAADLVVGRAGANTIFELAALGKPSILVPFAAAANGHQLANAYEYEKAKACRVLEESNFLPGLVTKEIAGILGNATTKKQMSEAAKAFFIPGAGAAIARDILGILGLS